MKTLIFAFLALVAFAATPAMANDDCNDQANEARLSDRVDDAILLLDLCLTEELSRVARTYLLLGLAHYEQSDQKKAIANYTRAIEIAPAYVTAYANRGLSYAMAKDFKEAMRDFDRAIEIDPEYMQAYYFRAFAHQRHGDHQKAIEDFNVALTLTQDKNEIATIYYNRGRTYRDLDKLNDALADYTQALTLNPNYASAYFSRGLLQQQTKNNDAAIADYSRAIESNPDHAQAYYNRGLLYRKEGTDFRAMKDFDKAIDIDPAYGRAYANKGYTFMIPILPLLFIFALG